MADWFKFYNDGLDAGGLQYCISENPLAPSVLLVILSEASKNRSSKVPWDDKDFRLLGLARKVNISPGSFNQCISLLEHAGYIVKKDGFIEITDWERLQSDYARGLDRGYYKSASNKLASYSQVSSARGEEKRGEENRREKKEASPVGEVVFPSNLNTDRFKQVWQEWEQHRKEKKKPNTSTSRLKQINKLSQFGESRAIAALNHSMANGYQGIFEPPVVNGIQRPKSEVLAAIEKSFDLEDDRERNKKPLEYTPDQRLVKMLTTKTP